MLTKEKLQAMHPHERIAMGVTTNSPEGVYMTDSNIGREMIWVAKRGFIEDWAIYIHWATLDTAAGVIPASPDYVAQYGQKIQDKENIRKLVLCTDDAIALYRF